MRAQALLDDSITVNRPTQHNGSVGLRSLSLSLKATAPTSCPYHLAAETMQLVERVRLGGGIMRGTSEQASSGRGGRQPQGGFHQTAAMRTNPLITRGQLCAPANGCDRKNVSSDVPVVWTLPQFPVCEGGVRWGLKG